MSAISRLAVIFLLFLISFGAACGTGSDDDDDNIPDSPMAHIPPGEFDMGCDSQENPICAQDIERVFVDGFFIDIYEARAVDYQKCIDDGFCTKPHSFINDADPLQPAIGISYDHAEMFCEYMGKRLPTSAEWEKAARGDQGGHNYPWGDTWNPTWANWCDGIECDGSIDGYAEFAHIDAFPENVSPYGVRNMAGNMNEWTSDIIYPEGNFDFDYAMIWRGGSYFPPNMNGDPNECMLSWKVCFEPPAAGAEHAGVRCAISEKSEN